MLFGAPEFAWKRTTSPGVHDNETLTLPLALHPAILGSEPIKRRRAQTMPSAFRLSVLSKLAQSLRHGEGLCGWRVKCPPACRYHRRQKTELG